MVHKDKMAFRPSLDPKGTLSSILTIKLAKTVPAHGFEPTKELLKTAKSATWEYNKAHSKKQKKKGFYVKTLWVGLVEKKYWNKTTNIRQDPTSFWALCYCDVCSVVYINMHNLHHYSIVLLYRNNARYIGNT